MVRGDNVISFELETGRDQYYVVGCYIPPSKSDGSTLASISNVMEQIPKGAYPSRWVI